MNPQISYAVQAQPLLHITLSTHNFSVTKIAPRVKDIIFGFGRQNVQFGMVRMPGGRYVKAAVKVFGAATMDRSEFRFHINQYKAFIDFLLMSRITENLYTISVKEVSSGETIDVSMKDGWVSKDYQIPVIEYIEENNEVRSKFVELQTGQGKAQPLTAKIKVPNGWSTMGEMKVGTEVVAKDGTTTRVTAVYPQGEKDIYKITFADGRSTECCAEHLWRIYYINTSINKRWKIVNTIEILRLISMPNPRVYIELIDAQDYPDLRLPIDPYLLGVLIGDGHLGKNNVVLSNPDKEIIDNVRQLLPPDIKIRSMEGLLNHQFVRVANSGSNNLLNLIRTLELSGKLSYEKFIPKFYLFGSIKQRLSILQGLMDTDGTVGKDGTSSYSTTSKQLSLDVQYLVRSLGGIAYISSKIPTFTYLDEKKNGRLAYQVNIRIKKPSCLFRLKRKGDRTNDNNQYGDILKLRVKSVELIDKKDAQCISIEHPDHLYVTDDFIVTHNTYSATQALVNEGKRVVTIVKGTAFVEKWESDFLKMTNVKKKDIIKVQGSAQLKQLIQLGADGLLNCSFIIIGNRTFQNYLKDYEEFKHDILTMGYACLPEDFFETVGAGRRLIDEVHMDFHLNYKIDMYSNVEKSVALSATLINLDPFLERMYKLAYPLAERYEGGPLKKYTQAKAILYSMNPNRYFNTTERDSPTYSHNAFERSILKSNDFTRAYLELVLSIVKSSNFTLKYKKGQKIIIFFASLDMVDACVKYMKAVYTNFDVRKFVGGDDLQNLLEADISITTLQNAGTGHDVPNLVTVILTTAVQSIQSNIQVLGRLREIPGVDVDFLYFACRDIPKQMDYHMQKLPMLEQRAASVQILNAPKPV